MSIEYNKKNIVFAKNLRKNATRQEKKLWYDFLSKYSVRFQRQKAIGDYIADFYCQRAKLIIELDGSQHYTLTGKERDKNRTEALSAYGLSVLRFTNEQIDCCFKTVCESIDNTVQKIINTKEKTDEVEPDKGDGVS